MDKLLQLKGVSKTFSHRDLWKTRRHAAIHDLDLDIYQGETLGMVGESGSGKTTTGRIILGLTMPTSGQVIYRETEVSALGSSGLKAHWKRVQGIFQDSAGTLDPRMSVGNSVMEVILTHYGRDGAREKTLELFELVQLGPELYQAYPHELSGGQKQRLGLARCLALKPELLVCDEPVASLDISVQVQVLKLFRELQEQKGLTYLFISHDLRVIRYISHRVAVMYKGRLLELAPTGLLFTNPKHPYTRTLLASMPRLGSLEGTYGELPQPAVEQGETLGGCPYFSRCSKRAETCRTNLPPMKEVGEGHWVRCPG